MEPIPREERLLNLLAALLAARSPLPFAEICANVAGYDDPASAEALEKRFDRDKSDLRSIGIPIEYVQKDETGASGYRVEQERFFLREIRFTVEEGIVLAALQGGASATGSGPMEESLRSALAKVGVDSPLSSAFRDSVADQQVLDPRALPDPPEAPQSVAALLEAVAALRAVRFRYYSLRSGKTASRCVEPYGIGFYRGAWYLVGRDRKKKDLRVFRTSRIRGPVEGLRSIRYTIPEDFNLRECVGVAPFELGEGPEVRARVRFAPEVAWMIRENVRRGQEFRSFKNGAGVLTLTARDEGALVGWVAEYGPAARVLGPPALRKRMAEHFRGILAGERP